MINNWNGEDRIGWGKSKGLTWSQAEASWIDWLAGEGDKAHAERERRELLAEANMSELERTVYAIFRIPLAEAHPDRRGGDHEKFIQLTRNRDLLLGIIREFKQQQQRIGGG